MTVWPTLLSIEPHRYKWPQMLCVSFDLNVLWILCHCLTLRKILKLFKVENIFVTLKKKRNFKYFNAFSTKPLQPLQYYVCRFKAICQSSTMLRVILPIFHCAYFAFYEACEENVTFFLTMQSDWTSPAFSSQNDCFWFTA